MKYIYFIFALLAITTSCELRSTNFDPDNQFVYEDELAQIAVWDQYQTGQLSDAEYEQLNYRKFIATDINYRQNKLGKWIIEGSVRNFASEAYFKDAQFVISYFDEGNQLVGTDNYTLNEVLAPGDQTGFYLKSNRFKHAQSLKVGIKRVKPVLAQN